MANTFFTSDYHFWHYNVLKYDNRPFDDLDKMHSEIIRKHNERVTNDDTIFFLGDLGFYSSINRAFRGEGQPNDPDELLSKMNGKYWNFVRGNHDRNSNKFKPKTELMILNQNGLRIQLIHDPLYANIDYDLILCGHIHCAWKVKEVHYLGQSRLIINVGVPVWNYYPVKLDEILSIYYKWKAERSKIKRWEQPLILTELNKGLGNAIRNNQQLDI